ncbi:MAG: tripartite tricarboxylate transporter TctB family protein [Lachnospiraceae bacterium]|nr:tripartite tricarboxylate transporter TctB family protein [Lachnospiraceae bacterium]
MLLELIFNVVLFIFSIYAYVLVGITSPAATATELGAAFWPRIILVLLAILVAVNIFNIWKKGKAEGNLKFESSEITSFFKSKIFIGMVMVIVMAFVLEYAGFMLTTCIFIMAYGRLLGQKSPVKLILSGVIATVVLYVIFQGALDIMLPRGYGFLRDFALMVETLLPF